MSDELIFTKEELGDLLEDQLEMLLRYYGIDPSEIVDIDDAWNKLQQKFPTFSQVENIPGENVSVRVKRIREANKKLTESELIIEPESIMVIEELSEEDRLVAELEQEDDITEEESEV